jgi:hypothetical protein
LTLSVRSFHVPPTPGHDSLAAEAAVGADLSADARHFGRERAQLLDHRVQRLFEKQDLAADVDRIFFDKSPLAMAVATSAMFRTCAVRLLAMKLTLRSSPSSAGDTRHLAWPPNLPSVPTFARHARDFGRKARSADRPSC